MPCEEIHFDSVHEVGGATARVRVFPPQHGEVHPRQSNHRHVERVQEEDDEEAPEADVKALAVRPEHEGHFLEVGDALRQTLNLHLGREQNHNQEAAHTCQEAESGCHRQLCLKSIYRRQIIRNLNVAECHLSSLSFTDVWKAPKMSASNQHGRLRYGGRLVSTSASQRSSARMRFRAAAFLYRV